MKLLRRSDFFSDEAQDIDRTKYITSSDIGAILGVNPHQSKADCFYKKFGIGKPFEGNRASKLGKDLELSLAFMVEERIKLRLGLEDELPFEFNKRVFHDNGLYSCELDCYFPEQNENAELKMAGLVNPFYNKHNEWGLGYDFKKGGQHDDAIPEQYVTQTQFAMMCSGADACNIQGLIGAGVGDRYYYVERNEKLCQYIDNQCQLFWEDVLKFKEPLSKGLIAIEDVRSPFSDSVPSSDTLKVMPRTPDKSILLSDEHWLEYVGMYDQTKLLKSSLEVKQNEIKALMEDAEYGETTLGTFTYLANKNGTRTFRHKERNLNVG